MSDFVWRVVVMRDIDEEAARALARVGATHISGHSGPGYSSSSLIVAADDEQEARRKIEGALGPHAFIREAHVTPVFVYAPIARDSRSTFERAAEDDSRVGGVIEDAITGELEVYFEFSHGDRGLAVTEARDLYDCIARGAGLVVSGPVDMRMDGFETLMTQPSLARERLDHARELLSRGEPTLAVVVAQTACEVLINDVLRTLVEFHARDELGPWVLRRVRSFTLIDDATRDLWYCVAGTKIQNQDFWSEYCEHVGRRNRAVHRGETLTEEDAGASLGAADAVVDYVERATGPAPTP